MSRHIEPVWCHVDIQNPKQMIPNVLLLGCNPTPSYIVDSDPQIDETTDQAGDLPRGPTSDM